MSSLRLALKQSLQETGHLFKDKKKKKKAANRKISNSNSSSNNNNNKSSSSGGGKGRRPRLPGEPPRKRGRPRKHPLPEDQQLSSSNSLLELQHSLSADSITGSRGDGDGSGGNHKYNGRDLNRGGNQHHSGSDDEQGESESENEFSYDSEEEVDDSEEGDENEDEDDNDNDDSDDSHTNEGEESGHAEDEVDVPTAVTTGPPSPRERERESKKKSRHEEEESDEDQRRRQKKLFKKRLQQAANKIQAQWKKKSGFSASSSKAEGGESDGDEGNAEDTNRGLSKFSASSPIRNREASFNNSNNSTPTTGGAEKKKKMGNASKSKAQTVPSPELDVLEWNRSLSEKKSRKHVASGMRVKVRFAAKVKREGKVVKKKIWYGGRVSAVSKEGSKIRIKYDDGTSEISRFPDKDVVVDDTFNGHHLVPADRFIPPERKQEVNANQEDGEKESEMEVDKDTKPSATPSSKNSEPPPKPSDPVAPASIPNKSSVVNEEQPITVDDVISESLTQEKQPTKVDPTFSEKAPSAEKPEPITYSTAAQPAETKVKKAESEEATTPKSKSTGAIIASAISAAEQGHLRRELGSPEEGELSPGQSLMSRPKVSTTKFITPLKCSDAEPQTFEPGEIYSALESSNATLVEPQPEAGSATDKIAHASSEAKTQTEDNSAGDSLPDSKESPTTSKRNLTIRISNAKKEQDGGVKTPKSVQSSDSEEELFADTPITQRKVKSIHLKKKIKRKREAAEATSEEQPSKKRIILKNPKPEDENEKSDISMSHAEDGMSDAVQRAVETMVAMADPQHTDGEEKKSNTTISISLRKSDAEEKELPMLPKLKKKKDRTNSPVPRLHKSSVPRSRSPTPVTDLGGVENSPAEPESTATGDGIGADRAIVPSRSKGVVSLADGVTNDPHDSNFETPAIDGNSLGPDENLPLQRSKGSTESLSNMRSGRRAAQQAKEMIKQKQDDKGLESMVKKKKRKRIQGDEEGEHSDGSVDDRQWVQCDSCGKWRILPSQIKISSLPNHWYCYFNTYDIKRNNCSAPEQTAKQAAKDWRKARKRAKQQRLAVQQAVQAEVAQEEPPAEIKKDLPASISPKPPKAIKKDKLESRKASPVVMEEAQPIAGESSVLKPEKKSKKIKQPQPQPQPQPPQEVVEAPPLVLESDGPKKTGRKRGRPARNQTPQKEKENNDDNVEWVQCEKCEKWRKLPPHISADELPDTWYCTMNTWNMDTARCDAPEDKADATHHEVGSYAGLFGAGASKYSYRAMIFGTGKKHNRPMSERSRAAESLFLRPVDEVENPYPTVMYSKSSCFLPRTSNFTKGNSAEHQKMPSIFDVLSNTELWAELSTVGQPMQVSSSNAGASFPKTFPRFLSFENLPEDTKQAMRDIVLRSMGDGTLSAEEIMMEVQGHPWETYSAELASIRDFFNNDIIVNSLLTLVKEGVVEMTSIRNFSVPIEQWVPKYRKVRSVRAMKIEEAIKASRCIKISKPWKQREGGSEWVTGASAFS